MSLCPRISKLYVKQDYSGVAVTKPNVLMSLKRGRVSQLVLKQLFISFNMLSNSRKIEMASSHPLSEGDSSPTYSLGYALHVP